MEAIEMNIQQNLSRTAIFLAAILVLASSSIYAYAEDTALVLYGKSEAFQQVVQGITGDLQEDLAFKEIIVDKDTSSNEIKALITAVKPKIIILVGNHSINAYTKYQQENQGDAFPPAVALAALYVDQLVRKLQKATGIRYEIPAVTSAVNLRSLLNTPLKKVGVIYRSWMNDFIEENKEYCRREGIELIGYEIDGKSDKYGKDIKKGIKALVKKNVDAFWVVNDNALLDQNGLIKGWIPGLKKVKKPIIVGVKSLIQTKFHFGSYAIVPDHYALGVQGASTIAEIMEDNWSVENRDIEQPLSINTLVNLKIFDNKDIEFKTEKLDEIDEVIKE